MSPNPEEQQLVEHDSTDQTNVPNKKERPPPHKKKPKDEVTFRTHLTSLAHISVVLFVYLIFKLATRTEFDFFTWHPLLMSIGVSIHYLYNIFKLSVLFYTLFDYYYKIVWFLFIVQCACLIWCLDICESRLLHYFIVRDQMPDLI